MRCRNCGSGSVRLVLEVVLDADGGPPEVGVHAECGDCDATDVEGDVAVALAAALADGPR